MKKMMKKLLTIGLSVLLMLGVCLTSVGCKLIDKRTKWYTAKVLTNCALENLPKPDYNYKGHNDIYRQIDGDITETVFHQYAQQVFSYMDNKFERFDERHEQFVYEEDEILQALQSGGFTVQSVEGHLGEEKTHSDRLLFTAVKR